MNKNDSDQVHPSEADQFDREIELVRGNEELMNLLARRSEEGGKVPLARAREMLGI